jgi:hypothetical protein
MNYLQFYIYLIIFIKLIFISLAITILYLKFKGKKDTEIYNKIIFWKHRVEFIFVFLMSILLIYIFNPRIERTKHLNNEIKLLLYLFGFITLLTAEWDIFFKESPLLKDIKSLVTENNH